MSLNPDGPHSPDYTRQVGEAFAESVRVLNHATAGKQGLTFPADAYDLLGCLMTGTAGLEQTARQLAQFLEEQLQAERLAVPAGRYAGRPGVAVAAAGGHLKTARIAARQLADTLDRAQQAISDVSAASGEGADA